MRLNRAQLIATLGTLGVLNTDRTDAGETAVLERELTRILTTLYEVKYPELMALQALPLDTQVQPGDETWIYRMFDQYGMAKIIGDDSTDLPPVGVSAVEYPSKLVTFGSQYQYTHLQLIQTRQTGRPLDEMKGRAARRAMALLVDNVLAFGDTVNGIPGFLNNANITEVSATGGWASATPAQIMADLNRLSNAPGLASRNTFMADSVLFPTAEWYIINQTYTSDLQQKTIYQQWRENSPWIKNAFPWYLLDTANTEGTGPRAVAYKRDIEVLKAVVPLQFLQLPPQARALAYVVPCMGRIGGVQVVYPLGAAYADLEA